MYIIKKYSKQTDGGAGAAARLEARVNEIAELAGVVWREHYTKLIGAEQVEYMLAKFQTAERMLADINENGYVYLTAAQAGADGIIGYGAVAPHDGYLLLSKLYVHADYRGKGAARAMLGEVITVCRTEYRLSRIRLTVNKYNDGSIAAYKKFGFATVDSVKTDIGGGFFMDDYIMELALPD